MLATAVPSSSQTRRWTIIGMLSLGVIIAYVDRTNFSVALAAKDFKALFHLTDVDRGTLNSAFFWSYAFLQIPAGWLVDRYGVKLPYAISFLVWSLVSAGTSLATSVSQLFALRFLLGVGESAVTPASMRWMPDFFVEKRHLSLGSMGLYTFFSFSGMAAVAALAGWAADWMIGRGGDPVGVRKAFTIAGFVIASTEVFGAMSDSVPVALFFAVFSLSGLGLATANYWALTQTLIPGGAIGRIVGIQNCAANLPGIVAPILTGWLIQKTGSYEAPMQAIWFFLLLGIAA